MTISRKELQARIEEVEKDLQAFIESRRVLHTRLLEIENTPHYEFLHEWAGTQALMNVFIMTITRCEGLLEDMRANLAKLPVEAPTFRLVKGEDDD